jgi:hypothetical protein
LLESRWSRAAPGFHTCFRRELNDDQDVWVKQLLQFSGVAVPNGLPHRLGDLVRQRVTEKLERLQEPACILRQRLALDVDWIIGASGNR